MKTHGLAISEETFKFLKEYFGKPIKIKVEHGQDVLYSLTEGRWKVETLNTNWLADQLRKEQNV